MRPEQAVASAWADKIARTIVQSVIAYFEGLPRDCMQSGDNSSLLNVWEEYCAQVQDEESVFWDVYSEMADDELAAAVEKLDRYEKLALWLQTDEGWDWNYDYMEGQDAHEVAPVLTEEIVRYLKDKLHSAAADYESETLDRYIYQMDEADEYEEEDAADEPGEEELGR